MLYLFCCSGINDRYHRRDANMRAERLSIEGHAHLALSPFKDIPEGVELAWNYNSGKGVSHYPTHHFTRTGGKVENKRMRR